MTHGHFIERCVAGHVVNQCRCIGPKSERVLPGPCRCPTASTASIAHIVSPPAPAMPSEGEWLPTVTHTGEFNVLGYRLTVHTLSDGQRVYEDTPELQRLLADMGSLSAPPQKTQEEPNAD